MFFFRCSAAPRALLSFPTRRSSDLPAVYILDYRAASSGQTLIVEYTARTLFDADYGNVSLEAATLSDASLPNAPPSVSLSSPTNNASFTAGANITLQADANDSDGGVAQVQFFDGTTSLGIDTSSPYSASANNLAAGPYTLSAVAIDNLGAMATNSVNIVVDAPPTVTITSPTNSATFAAPADIRITATASDSDGSISKVEFFEGFIRLG